MASREEQLEKDRRKAMGELLVAECRAPESSLDSLSTMIESGADVCFSHAKPLYWATKLLKFDVVKFLVRNGSLADPIAASYIAKMCDTKGFDESKEAEFFEVLDLCSAQKGNYIELFTPYINSMAVTGRMDKLRALMQRYYLTEAEVAGAVYIRIIFEMILHAQDEMLDFLNRHVQWMNQSAFDLAVSSGDWVVLEYLLQHSDLRTPGETAAAQAVYNGCFKVLDLLTAYGFTFDRKPVYLKKACRAANADGTAALEYLLRHGYTLRDTYDGRSVRANATLDKNEALLRFLDRMGVGE